MRSRGPLARVATYLRREDPAGSDRYRSSPPRKCGPLAESLSLPRPLRRSDLLASLRTGPAHVRIPAAQRVPGQRHPRRLAGRHGLRARACRRWPYAPRHVHPAVAAVARGRMARRLPPHRRRRHLHGAVRALPDQPESLASDRPQDERCGRARPSGARLYSAMTGRMSFGASTAASPARRSTAVFSS